MAVDANLIVRNGSASGSLAADFTSDAVNVGEAPLHSNLELMIRVPNAIGSTPTLDITIWDAATSGGTLSRMVTVPQITAVGVYKARFQNRPGRPYIKVWCDVGFSGGGTTCDFGAVDIYVAPIDYPAINGTAV